MNTSDLIKGRDALEKLSPLDPKRREIIVEMALSIGEILNNEEVTEESISAMEEALEIIKSLNEKHSSELAFVCLMIKEADKESGDPVPLKQKRRVVKKMLREHLVKKVSSGLEHALELINVGDGE